MSAKRMRIFAGPNGSGKTTIIKKLNTKFNFGVYINADDIEQLLHKSGELDFGFYNVNIEEDKLKCFFRESDFSPVKRNEFDLWKNLSVKNNHLIISTHCDSYLSADIAEYLRQQMLENNLSFTYETVMSHKSKIDFIQKAIDKNYKVYLYYISTEDPLININRVNLRVELQGHLVSSEKIQKRYYKSLENLKDAVKKTSRAYIFDNSGSIALLIAEITSGSDVEIFDTKKIPNWVEKYLLR